MNSTISTSFQAHIPSLARSPVGGAASTQPVRMEHAKGSAELATPTDDVAGAHSAAQACSQCGWDRASTGTSQSDGVPPADPFFCPQCQALMPLDKSIDHFTLLGL